MGKLYFIGLIITYVKTVIEIFFKKVQIFKAINYLFIEMPRFYIYQNKTLHCQYYIKIYIPE